MTKHFCDTCGKEASTPTMWDVRCDSRNTETYFQYEICSECMLEFTKLFYGKAESEEK